MAIKLSPLGIRVNAIGPGLIATPLNAKARENPDYMKLFTGRIPLGSIGTPEDIALPAVFLASDMARYITGVTLPVDGGYLSYWSAFAPERRQLIARSARRPPLHTPLAAGQRPTAGRISIGRGVGRRDASRAIPP